MSQTMPWYPLYHRDFDLDTGSWTVDEVGALVRLMNYQWANGSVPDDQIKLARICRVDPAKWWSIWETLTDKFEPVAPGKLVNHRLAIEQQRTTRRSDAGRKAAETRWGKRSKIKQPDATAHADDMVSTGTDTYREDKEGEASPPLPDGLNRDAWDDWLAYRRESRWKKWVPRTVKSRTKMLAQYTHEEQWTIILLSIDNGYKGLFPDSALGGSHGRRDRLEPAERVEQATGVKRL